MKHNYFNIITTLFLIILPTVLCSQPQLMTGFPFIDTLDGPAALSASAIVADFNNDNQNEILIGVNQGTTTGRIYLLDYAGRILNHWPKTIYNIPNYINSAAGDVNNDGFIDIIIRVKDSLFVWDFNANSLFGFPVYFGGGQQFQDLSDKLSIYDLDNDGKLEIIVNRGSNICVFNYNGIVRSGWPRDISIGFRTNVSPFSICDLNNDGNSEIIIPESHNNTVKMTMDSNMIYVLEENGENFQGTPIESDSGYYFAPSPATVFKNFSNETNFIINSNYSPDLEPYNYTCRTSTYNSSGNLINRFYFKPIYECYEIVLEKLNLLNQFRVISNSLDSLYNFNQNGVINYGWPVLADGGLYTIPVIGKTTDQQSIIKIRHRQDSIGGNGENRGYVWFFNTDGSQPSWSPLRTKGIPEISPTLCDLNNDGQLDMVYVSSSGNPIHFYETRLYAFTFPGVPYNPVDLPWPMYAHDRYRTNQYGFVTPDEPVSINNNNSEIPSSFILHQNYPNPFYPSTNISFSITRRTFVTLKVYDALGKEIYTLINEYKLSGNYNIPFDGKDLPSGIYYYILTAGDFTFTRKMALIK